MFFVSQQGFAPYKDEQSLKVMELPGKQENKHDLQLSNFLMTILTIKNVRKLVGNKNLKKTNGDRFVLYLLF